MKNEQKIKKYLFETIKCKECHRAKRQLKAGEHDINDIFCEYHKQLLKVL